MLRKNNRFHKINLYTIIAVYFLILVGGIVRSMGAGMGCPDWPKCFGGYIPPSSVNELPLDYEVIYSDQRVVKNQRLSGVLSSMGLGALAEKVMNDPNAASKTYYSAEKAWVEYINRLVGVVIGIFIVLNMILSFGSKDAWVKFLGVFSFILVLFQGWIGSLVVSTNLLPGFISFHMGLALLLVALLLVQRFRMLDNQMLLKGKMLIGIILFLFTVQIVFGTQVREQVDQIHLLGISKSSWISNLSILFYIHRSYSILLAILIGYFTYINLSQLRQNLLLYSLVITVVLEIALGAIMTYFNFPAFAQPAHLFLGTLSFGLIFYLFLASNFKSVSL